MSSTLRILKNIGVRIIAEAISKFLGFFFIIYAARYLEVNGFGVLSFALALTGILGIFIDFGFNLLITREVARNKLLAGEYALNVTLTKLFFSVLVFALTVVLLNFWGYSVADANVVYLILLFVVFNALSGTFNSIFQAFEKVEYVSIGMIIRSIFMLLGAYFAVNKGLGIIGFSLIYLLSGFIVFLYSFLVLSFKFLEGFVLKINWKLSIRLIKESIPFALTTLFVTVFYWIDSVMLSLMKGTEVVGLYNAAYRVVFFLLVIPEMFTFAIFPVTSKFYLTSKDNLKKLFKKHFKAMFVLAMPIGLGVMMLAKEIILLVFGSNYLGALLSLQILIWSAVFIFMSQPIASLLNSLNMQVAGMKIAGFCALFNIVLNLIVIPYYSFVGASIITVITEFISLALLYSKLLKTDYAIYLKDFGYTLVKVLASCALMALFILIFKNWNLFFLIASSTIIYFSLLYLFKIMDEEELNLLRKIYSDYSVKIFPGLKKSISK